MTKMELGEVFSSTVTNGVSLMENDGVDAVQIEVLVEEASAYFESLISMGNITAAEEFVNRLLPYWNAQLPHPTALKLHR